MRTMYIDEIIQMLEIQKELRKEEINIKKTNINSNYIIAKNDFRCIDNMEDTYETLDYIIDNLKECQERIIERNKLVLK